ncbi:hypothetical protein ENSA5_19840 [Enhygromyxa salina]|uniref:Muropeptide transporter n=1 Tax=Enhygromyxa salina TaxID=215803 RepID=A0A2S9YCQ2_9BACT|nr:hypothetical protein [Enhygromyxa salina]PRQ02894.1 hypothetical protein ENSA5_19840 [Enhygromyxa salina]
MTVAASEDSRALRCVVVVGAAYLVQGIVAAVGVLLLGRLAQLGIPLETQVGILASGAVPWLLKFAVALLLDLGPSWALRVRGLVLTALQGCAALCLWGLASAWTGGEGGGPGSLTGIAAGWVALNLAAALQDVLVDGLALDTLAGRQARTAAAMGLGHALGAGLLGPLVLGARIVDHGMVAGLATPAWWLAGLALVPAALLWLPGRPDKARAQRPAQRPLEPGELARLLWIPLLFVALTFGASATSGLSFEFLFQHLGWDYADYATILLPVAAIAGIVGALGWGPLVARLGPARASMIAAAGLGLLWLGFAASSSLWHQRAVIALLAGGEGLLQAALLVGLHALALVAAARSPMPTTAFVLGMAALNLPRVLAPLMSVKLVALGWAGAFATLAVLQLVAAAGLWPLRRSTTGVSADDAA